jgi:hypothetical protein
MRKTIEFWGPVHLLIDDAQLLPASILNELRAFTEEEWNGRGLVRILVSGPLSFEEDLARPLYSDFSRRIRCHAFLQPLTTKESIEFLSRHLEAAGGRLTEVFSSSAIELIVSACDGLPRCLSLLADESLVVAAELTRRKADDDCVQKALSRLQHLPYAWSASPIRSDENSFVEDDLTEISGKPRTIHSQTLPAATISHGVIEFGAPGVIEFGASPMVSAIDSQQTNLTDKQESERIQWLELPARDESPALSPLEAEDDVPASDVQSVFLDVMSDVTGADGAATNDMFGCTAATWIPMQTHVESGPGAEDPMETPARPTSWITFFCDEVAENEESEPPVDEQSYHSDATRDSNSEFAHGAFRERTPVFDRYTEIALGRDVSGLSRSQASVVTMSLAEGGCMIPGCWSSSEEIEPVATVTRDRIRVTRTSDQEISRLLTGDDSERESGTFFAFRSQAMIIKSGLGTWTAEGCDRPGCTDDCLAVEVGGIVNPESPWHDGQLIFGLAKSSPEEVPPVVVTPEAATTNADSEQVSLSFEAARAAKTQLDQISNEAANDVIENRRDESDSKREKFFTLPVDVSTIEWDLRSELADPDGVFPLAESLASLRDEVTAFQQGRRNILHDDSDGPEVVEDVSSSTESIQARDSLVARAKRQLEGVAGFRPAEIRIINDHKAIVAAIDSRVMASTAEEPTSAAAQTDNSLPNFGQLFTRLRQKRQQTVENDSR